MPAGQCCRPPAPRPNTFVRELATAPPRPPAARDAPMTLASLHAPAYRRRQRNSGPPVSGLGGCPMANTSVRPSTAIATGMLSFRGTVPDGRKSAVATFAPSNDQCASRPLCATANSSIWLGAGVIAAKPVRTKPAGAAAGDGSTLVTQFTPSVVRHRSTLLSGPTMNTSVTLAAEETAAGTHRGRLPGGRLPLFGSGPDPSEVSPVLQE